MSNRSYQYLTFVGLLLAAHGGHWFIGGSDQAATDLRNAAVWIQIVVGLAVTAWAWWKSLRLAA